MKIKYKLILGFSIIFITAIAIINPLIKNAIIKNNQKIVKVELNELANNISIYINQYLLLQNKKLTESYFNKNSDKILDDLRDKLEYPMYFYNTKSTNLSVKTSKEVVSTNIYDFKIQKLLDTKRPDLQRALNGKISFTITKYSDQYFVVFSYPVTVDSKTIGVLRLVKNYTTLYSSSNQIFFIFEGFLCLLFFILLLTFTIFSYGITNPIERLNSVAKRMSSGDFDVSVEIQSTDEIGELSKSFVIMKNRIKKQICDMKELEDHRKKFLDNVTHELKTPLTTISGYAQILNEIEDNDKEFLKISTKSIKREADRLNKMVVSLLEMSSLNEESFLYEMKSNDISKILLETVNEMKIKSNKYNFNIQCNIEENVHVKCVEEQMKQVFINILDNAIKYGEAGTTINVVLKIKSKNANIYIKNIGKSIPECMLDKIFDPFIRVDKNYSREMKSNGLGLSIVKTILDKHEGKISINSENDETEILISLQLCNNFVKTS